MFKMIVEFLLSVSGSSFAWIETKTNPCKESKKNQDLLCQLFPSHSAIVKIGKRNVSLGNSYANAVNNRLTKEIGEHDQFVAVNRDWAERLTTALIKHKDSGQMYLEYYYLNSNKSTYKYLWEDGTELTNDELTIAKDQLFKSVSTSKKQSDAGLDNEDQIKVNIVKIENILSLHAYGKIFENNELTIY